MLTDATQSLEHSVNNNQSVYIFCESYVQLDNTIRVIEQNAASGKNSIVLLGTESLYSLFDNVICRIYKNIYIISFSHTHNQHKVTSLTHKTTSSIVANIERIFFLKRLYKSLFSQLSGADVYIFCQYYNINSYYIIKRIIDRNRIHFIASRDYEEANLEIIKLTNIKYIIRSVLTRIMYGSGIDYVKFAHGGVASQINSKIFNKFYNYIPAQGRQKWLKEFQFDQVTYIKNEYDVIFYDFGDEILNYIADTNHYNYVIGDIFSLLNHYFKKNRICVKYHPTFKPSAALDKYGIVAPNYIPGEWYQKEGILLLGIFSTCVYNSKKGISISLINLFKYKNSDIKNNFIISTQNRELSDNKVFIPNTIDELEQIIKTSLAVD